jgi:hypothetical protein
VRNSEMGGDQAAAPEARAKAPASRRLGWLRARFLQLGRVVGARPLGTLASSVVVCLLLALPSAFLLVEETDLFTVWVPTKSQAQDDYSVLEPLFGKQPVGSSIIAVADADGPLGGNLLQEEPFVALQELRNEIVNTYVDVCHPFQGGGCDYYSALGVWEDEEPPVDIVANLSPDILIMKESGRSIPRDSLLGGVSSAQGSAEATQMIFMLTPEAYTDAKSLAWQRDSFLPACRSAEIEGVTLFCFAPVSYGDESDAAMMSDTILLGVGMLLQLIVVALLLGRTALNPVQSKFLLAFTVLGTVGLSLGVAFGIASIFGVPYTQASLFSFFIILGVGVDDMFIVTDCFRRHADILDTSERLGATLEEVGISILFTSVTDFCAFLTGVFIDIPAISYFCAVAALSVLAVFAVTVTSYAACLVLDDSREKAGRLDVVPCLIAPCRSLRPPPPPPDSVAGAGAGLEDHSTRPSRISSAMDSFGRWLLWGRVRGGILTLFICLAGLSTWATVTMLDRGLVIQDFLPDGSYAAEWLTTSEALWGEVVYIDYAAENLNLDGAGGDEQLNDLQILNERIAALPFTIQPTFTWLDAWKQHEGGSLPERGDRHARLARWLESDAGIPFAGDFVGLDDAAFAARMHVASAYPPSTDGKVEVMRISRQVGVGLVSITVRAFAFDYLWFERYDALYKTTLTSFAGTFAGILLAALIFLPPAVAIWINLCVIMVTVDIFGVMSLLGTPINVITLVFLILSVGFSVDYSVHIAESCVVAESGRAVGEVLRTLRDIGPSVLKAGFSTFTAVIVLTGSKSTAYQYMWQLFLCMVLFGVAHGLIFLPALLITSSLLSLRPQSKKFCSKKNVQDEGGTDDVDGHHRDDQ